MKKINNRKVHEIGKHIFEDDFHKVYILNSQKNGYLMLDTSNQKIFQLLRLRFVIAVMLGFVVDYYLDSLILSVLVVVSVFAILQITYSYLFLPKLVAVKSNIDFNEKSSFKDRIQANSKMDLIKKSIISFLVCGLFVYNFITLNLSLTNLVTIGNIETFLTTMLYILMIIFTLFYGLLLSFYTIQKGKVNRI